MTRPKSVLVVDDDPYIRMIFEAAAAAFHVSMDVVQTVKQAKAIICQNAYSFIFLDIKLETPEGGMEVLSTINQVDPSTSVIIMSSGVSLRDVLHRAMSLGVLSFIDKPTSFTVEYLVSIFRKLGIPPSGHPPTEPDSP